MQVVLLTIVNVARNVMYTIMTKKKRNIVKVYYNAKANVKICGSYGLARCRPKFLKTFTKLNLLSHQALISTNYYLISCHASNLLSHEKSKVIFLIFNKKITEKVVRNLNSDI